MMNTWRMEILMNTKKKNMNVQNVPIQLKKNWNTVVKIAGRLDNYKIKTIMKTKLISMPEQLFEKIKESAIRNDRSVNKEITKILKKSFKKNERPN